MSLCRTCGHHQYAQCTLMPEWRPVVSTHFCGQYQAIPTQRGMESWYITDGKKGLYYQERAIAAEKKLKALRKSIRDAKAKRDSA